MKVTKFTIKGRIPSKKNNRRNFRGTSLPSERYEAWLKNAHIQLLQYRNKTIDNVQSIQMDFYFPDNRATDLDNKSSSVLDMLKHKNCRIIEDDCWQKTGPIYLNPMGIDRENPRVEIWIKHNS